MGNRLRGDDGAGCRLADMLNGKTSWVCLDGGVTPENMVSEIARLSPRGILLVDAVHLGMPAGTLEWLDPAQVASLGAGTHHLPMELLIQFLTERTGSEVRLLGIQPAQTRFGCGLSPPVRSALLQITQLLFQLSAELPEPETRPNSSTLK